MMKKLLISTILTICATGVLTSCSEDDDNNDVVSATDPFPYPEEYIANKDKSVKPGDSFYDYCNGAWLASNPIPTDPSKNLGGLYAAISAMEEKKKELKTSVPDLNRFFSLMEHIHDKPEASRAYIEAQKAKIKKPLTKEEAYRTIGKMYIEGVNVLGMTFSVEWDKDKLKAVFLTGGSDSKSEPEKTLLKKRHLTPLLQTRAAGKTSIPALLAEGMGIDPSLINTEKDEMDKWEKYWDMFTVDDLYQKMQDGWMEYEPYVSAPEKTDYDDNNAEIPSDDQPTVEKLCAKARVALGYTISYHFQQKFFPQSLKDKYLSITKEIQTALRKRIQKVDWMSETTKQNAIDKIDHYGLNVGFPDTWHTDCIPALADCETMVEALHRLNAANARLLTKLVGTNDVFSFKLTEQDFDSDGLPMSLDLTLVNAIYSAGENCVTIYPAMLLPPIMPADGMSEACYYAVFSIIGHEFTHGFDNEGSKWDKYGENKNWWTVADIMAFQDRKENLIRTYDNMELDPQRAPLVLCDGKRTEGENIADLGGFLTALDAYIARLDAQGFTGETRNEQLRKFYESYAHLWCIQYGQNKFDILKKSDNHSHARLRINGVVMNTDLWYELYNVDRNNLLYLPPERRAYIW